MNLRLNRFRTVSAVGVILLVALLVAACGQSAPAGQPSGSGSAQSNVTLVVTSYGGSYDDTVNQYVVKPFEARYPGVTVKLAPYTSVAKLSAQGGQGIDVVQLDDFDIVDSGNKGLLVPLKKDGQLTYWGDLYPQAFLKGDDGNVYGLANVFGSWGIAYNTDKVTPPPTSWTVFWDPKYAGHVAQMKEWIPDIEMAAKAFSATQDNMSPVWDAFSKLTPGVKQYYSSFSAPQALLESGDVWLVSWFDGRAFALQAKGDHVAFALPDEGGVLIRGAVGVLKSSKNQKVAEEFVNFMMSPEAQQGFAKALYYGPTNSKVQLPADLASKVVYGRDSLSRLTATDWTKVLPKRDDWVKSWNAATGE